MDKIEDLLRKRKEFLDSIDKVIRTSYTKPVTLLFTDIVGSTHYFEEMGDIAGRQMIQTHNDLLFPIITSRGGRIIKTIGDSIMATFENPGEGVECAVSMQESLAAFNRAREGNEKIRVRMGLHYGHAVIDEEDLFGDMVNTAARVEARADGEEIIISSELAEMCETDRFPMVLLGNDTVKGKKKEIGFYLVNWNSRMSEEILSSWQGRTAARPHEDKQKKSDRPITVRSITQVRAKPEPERRGNPFLNRVMIPHPSMFFGRESIVKRVMSRLSSEKPQSVSIVGERRIGKSSLLNFLNFPDTRRENLRDAGKYIFTFIDFQSVRSVSANEVVSAIFQEMRRQVDCVIGSGLKEDFEGMRALCQCLAEDGYRLILLFDEFESITKNANIGPDFYSFFRSLANNYAVAFVTASGRNLKDMCVSRQISDSPFFNIFAVHYLGLFNTEEAHSLVTKPSEDYGIPLAPVADTIVAEGGRYPFFLQIMSAAWFEYLESEGKNAAEYAGKPTPREVLSFFREEAEPHFEFVLEMLSDEERSVLSELCKGTKPIPEDRYTENLERKGYMTRTEEGSLMPFGREFGRFLSKRFSEM